MGENKVLLFLQKVKSRLDDAIECHAWLGGLLRYYRPERLKWQGRAGCPIVSAVLARGVCAVIPLFFYADEIAAAMMLLFFWELEWVSFLTIRENLF